MNTRTIEIPEDLLVLFRRSRLGTLPEVEQVRYALAIHLFQEGLITVARAAELSGEPLASFELLLGKMGIPPVRYDVEDFEEDIRNIQAAEHRATAS
jgi:predicted HTH domain antitoxin